VAVDGYRYGTKAIDRSSEVDAIVAALPGLRHVVGLRYLGTGPDGWTGLLAGEDPGPADFTPVPSDHPLYVLFSSGTTGLPKAIGAGVQLTSIAGGTDVCTAFVGMNPLTPVRAGEITGPLPGCSVEAFDAAGRPCPPGELGELVITAPMPSMPVGFWGDDDGS